jgi:transcriptional regulator with XRE-family HTH domain
LRAFGGIEVTETKPSFAQGLLEQAESLHSEAADLKRGTSDLKNRVAQSRLAELQAQFARWAPADILAELSSEGLAWRDIARILGVSVPAVQKWRRGEAVSPRNRAALAKLRALTRLAESYMIADPATWLEMPVAAGTTITGIDLLAEEKADVVLALMWSGVGGPEAVLDELAPEWRGHSPSREFETYLASDGQVSVRLTRGGDDPDPS